MINGLYSAAAGMLAQTEQQDAIANNLANSNTPGYKRVSVSFSAFTAAMDNATRKQAEEKTNGVECTIPIPSTSEDSGRGVLQHTESATNFAIDGPGYFVVSDGKNTRLTRNGDFVVGSSGVLETTDGEKVLGQNGPIQVSGTDWKVEEDGSVRVGNSVSDKIRISTGNDTRATGQSVNTRILQGSLEGSNVSPVKEMVSMITGVRAYEANQKVIQAMDQILDKIINTGGRTS